MPKRQIFEGMDLHTYRARRVRDYHGTTTISDRRAIPPHEVRRSLSRLDLDYDEIAETISTVEKPSSVEAAFEDAKGLVDRNGDLLVAPPNDRKCMGVLHWRAMSLACKGCPVANNCYKIVKYRLTYGGLEQFKLALGNRERLAKRNDTLATGRSQGYELESSELWIRDLKTLYYAYWRESDRTVSYRLAGGRRKKPKEPDSIAEKIRLLSTEKFDEVRTDHYGSAPADGKLETALQYYADFRESHKSEHRWRELKPARLAIIEVCWNAVKEAHKAVGLETHEDPNFLYRGDLNEIHACAEDLLGVIDVFFPELSDVYGPKLLDYNQTRRYVETIKRIRNEKFHGLKAKSSPEAG